MIFRRIFRLLLPEERKTGVRVVLTVLCSAVLDFMELPTVWFQNSATHRWCGCCTQVARNLEWDSQAQKRERYRRNWRNGIRMLWNFMHSCNRKPHCVFIYSSINSVVWRNCAVERWYNVVVSSFNGAVLIFDAEILYYSISHRQEWIYLFGKYENSYWIFW